MHTDSLAYIRERMRILDLICYNMERRPGPEKDLLLWMPAHPAAAVFAQMLRDAGFRVQQAYAYGEEAAPVCGETPAYVIDYDGSCPPAIAGSAQVIACKNAGHTPHCLAGRRVYRAFLNARTEMQCVLSLLQDELGLLFNGVNAVIGGYNEELVTLGRYLSDRNCMVRFDTEDATDRLELIMGGGRLASARAYNSADIFFAAEGESGLAEKLSLLKTDCVVINLGGRGETERLKDRFAKLGECEQALPCLWTRTRADGARLHLMFHGDDALARSFRYLPYEVVDMVYAGCAAFLWALEAGEDLTDEALDAKLARLKLGLMRVR